MDAIDNPDHGRRIYNGVGIVQHPYIPQDAAGGPSVSPEGGPTFPALEDVQISSVPT